MLHAPLRLHAPLKGVVRVGPPEPVKGVAAVRVDPPAPIPTPVAAPAPPSPPPAPPPPPPDPEPARRLQAQKEREQVEGVLGSLTELARQLQDQQRQRLAEMQQVAVEVAVAVASRLVRERIETGEYAVEALVREVVEQLQPAAAVTVRLHPQDLALLEQRLGDEPLLEDATEIRWVADPELSRGDCRGETADQGLLSRLDEQLATIRRSLLEHLAEAEIERRQPTTGLRRFPDRRQTA